MAQSRSCFGSWTGKSWTRWRSSRSRGVAVGVFHRGREYVRGFGVTDVGNQRPVDADTVFRIASTSKTFTGTTAMRLVDTGRLDLDVPVRRYITNFRPSEGAEGVTVRQLLNHSAGWLGYDYHDTGKDDGALARYVEDVHRLPQLTPVGRIFSYNNTAISVAGRVIETITGTTFEQSVRELVLDPLGLNRSGYSIDEIGDENVATPHAIVDGRAVAQPDLFFLPRSGNPFGGVLSSVTDQLAYARFHLGDGRSASGERVMSKAALRGMWSRPGPGGTLIVELTGMGVSWMVRPTAEGIPVVQHGGDLPGFHSGFLIVPERQFAITMLTNCESGPNLIAQLFYDDWALRRFAGLSNLPAATRRLSDAELAPYEGTTPQHRSASTILRSRSRCG
jgi:CubicO group peptidase (beta-lactamase class C family)